MNTSQVILVSGASSGFGRLTVETLARQGHHVFAGIRNTTGKNAVAVRKLQALAKADGLKITVLDVDVTDDASVEAAVETVIAQAGRVDVVVNNAGRAYFGATEAFRVEQVQQQFDTNVFSLVRLNRAVLPYMRRQRSGLLIHLSSVVGRMAFPFTGVYAASKFAVEGLTEAYRHELAPFGVDAVVIEPGTYPTRVMANSVVANDALHGEAYSAGFAAVSEILNALPVPGQAGSDPQEVADAIARVVALPFGARPLRTIVASEAQQQGVAAINVVSQQVIDATMAALSPTASAA